jgi:isopenicillin-N N-acyltransferase-like protein
MVNRKQSDLPVISVKGDAYNLGLEHGQKARELVQKNVDYYLYLWKTYSNMEREVVLEKTREFIKPIEKYDNEILEELRGVADGAKVMLEEIIALNSRYEFVWSTMGMELGKECTSIGATMEATSNNHTLIGMNWDYKSKVEEQIILLEILQENKPNIVMRTEAGIIGFAGFNSAGIGLVLNALCSDKDSFEPKTPFLVMCRGVLNAGTLPDALSAVIATERAVSGNLLIAHEDGEIIDLESTPFDVGFMYPVKGVLAHANNFVDLRFAQNVVDTFKALYPDSIIRTNRAQRFLEGAVGNINLDTFKEILRDHFGKPSSICRHLDPKLHIDINGQSKSIIMDLNEKTMSITNGPPCEYEYETFTFESLRKKFSSV